MVSPALLLFVRMWAVAHVIHLTAANHAALDRPWNLVTVALALLVLLQPASGRLFALLAAAQLFDLVAEMPLSPDHWMLIGFVNLAILLTFAVRRSSALTGLVIAFPVIRVITLIAYSAAALAKWNVTFLDPVTSCAAAIAGAASFGQTGKLPLDPVWMVSVIATETMIPIMLAIPATRRHGVRIAMAFHFMLSISPAFAVTDFTAVLFALFLLFLSDEDVASVLGGLRWIGQRSAVARDVRRHPRIAAGLGFVVFGLVGHLAAGPATAVLYLACEIYLVTLLVTVLITWRRARGIGSFGRPQAWQLPVVALLLCWVALPYAGFRTTGVFTMFSGLRTEPGHQNHLFMPTYPLGHYQDDLVVIESSNVASLADAENGVAGAPLMALRRLATDDPELVVTGVLDGKRITFGPGRGQTRLEPLAWWEYKFLHFRAVASGDEPFCSLS